jgi:hypothetical protein
VQLTELDEEIDACKVHMEVNEIIARRKMAEEIE